MLSRNWLAFLQAHEPRCIGVCLVDDTIREHLKAQTSLVQIDRGYVLKILTKHMISTDELWRIGATINKGIAIEDKNNRVTFIHEAPSDSGQYFQATIKIAASRNEIYVCTFHRLRPAEKRRRLREARIIRGK